MQPWTRNTVKMQFQDNTLSCFCADRLRTTCFDDTVSSAEEAACAVNILLLHVCEEHYKVFFPPEQVQCKQTEMNRLRADVTLLTGKEVKTN